MRSAIFSGALFAALAFSGPVLAGDQYVDSSGFAISGFDVVAYWDKEQAPVGEAQPLATPGDRSITVEYNGATWAFATTENRDRFLADPERYVPQFDGHCAYGVGVQQGGKVPGNPHLWRIVDDRLYLNITENVVGFWEENIPGWIASADDNWNRIEDSVDASNREIPNFTAGQAPIGG
ncbi:MAG: YHS domain-containing (seleno)protein [Pseudomonadota bacterium]